MPWNTFLFSIWNALDIIEYIILILSDYYITERDILCLCILYVSLFAVIIIDKTHIACKILIITSVSPFHVNYDVSISRRERWDQPV